MSAAQSSRPAGPVPQSPQPISLIERSRARMAFAKSMVAAIACSLVKPVLL
jgi:hypothetical protein